MTGSELELELLEGGRRVRLAALCENAPRWSPRLLTGAANYISTQAIYARYPIRLEDAGTGRNKTAGYRRYYLLAVSR